MFLKKKGKKCKNVTFPFPAWFCVVVLSGHVSPTYLPTYQFPNPSPPPNQSSNPVSRPRSLPSLNFFPFFSCVQRVGYQAWRFVFRIILGLESSKPSHYIPPQLPLPIFPPPKPHPPHPSPPHPSNPREKWKKIGNTKGTYFLVGTTT